VKGANEKKPAQSRAIEKIATLLNQAIEVEIKQAYTDIASGDILARSLGSIVSPAWRSCSMIRVNCTVFQTRTALDSRLRALTLFIISS
jgi:hypothetical protein